MLDRHVERVVIFHHPMRQVPSDPKLLPYVPWKLRPVPTSKKKLDPSNRVSTYKIRRAFPCITTNRRKVVCPVYLVSRTGYLICCHGHHPESHKSRIAPALLSRSDARRLVGIPILCKSQESIRRSLYATADSWGARTRSLRSSSTPPVIRTGSEESGRKTHGIA